MGTMEAYERDFEEALLAETAAHYKRKAAAWIQVCIQVRKDVCNRHMIDKCAPQLYGGIQRFCQK